MKTYTVVLSGQTMYEGRQYNFGDRLRGLAQAEVARLQERGVVGSVIDETPEPIKTGPELVADMTVKEAIESLALMTDTEFIRQVIGIERAKASPRASLIKAAEERLAALSLEPETGEGGDDDQTGGPQEPSDPGEGDEDEEGEETAD